MFTLREDQEDVRTKLRVSLRKNSSVLCYAPPGFGKTVLAGMLTQMMERANKRVIFGVHRVDLIRQTEVTFREFGIPFSYIAAGYPHNPYMPVQIASIPTLKNRLGSWESHFLWVDEAHLSMAAGWHKVVDHYRKAGAKVIGLSGSPERLDGKPLKEAWDDMIMGPSVSWLIEQGFLSNYKAYAPSTVSTQGLHTRGGEFVTGELEALMSGEVLGDAVRHWRHRCEGMRTIAFAPSVKKSEELAAKFREAGIMAVALDGETPTDERRRAFNAFADGDIKVIVNCALFCEGFDLAAQIGRKVAVEAMLDWSPTMSLAKCVQKWGRAMRPDGGPPHVLLDLAGNFARHGLPCDDREWSLEGRQKKKKDEGEKVAICEKCGYSDEPPMTKCPECGYRRPANSMGGRMYSEVDGETVEIDQAARKKQRQVEQWQAKSLEDLIALGTDRGYRNPEKWAAFIWTARKSKTERIFR